MAGTHTHSHSSKSIRRSGRPDDGRRLWVIAVAITAAAVVGVGVAAMTVKAGSGANPAVATPTTTTAAADGALAADTAGPLTVAAATPANQASGVPTDATVSVQFSAPLSTNSPQPTITPSVAGSWQLLTPTTFTFVATAPFAPSSTETVTVPGGAGGITGATGKTLKDPVNIGFTVAAGSTLRLQQLLAELDYLPLSFAAAGPLAAPQEAAQAQQGTFAWRATEPASLQALWTVGTSNVITKAAVMTFENQSGMTTDGAAGPTVWEKLLAASAAGTVNQQPYNYVYVNNAATNETATVYSNGSMVYSTPANTGVPAAETAPGTFPVYVRYTTTTMSGTNPDGSKYVDPGIKWVSYFNGGDALHSFPRATYGTPQSVGCVEMPDAAAAAVFPLTPIGTLVTVS